MVMSINFKVGQELYVPRKAVGFKSPYPVTITKIGKRWLSLSNNHRADIDTLSVDGGAYSSPAICYLSIEAIKGDSLLKSAWDDFKLDVYHHGGIPEGLTVEAIVQMRKLLHLKGGE